MSTFSGRVAAITGAGSGIGRALAVELARRGSELGVSDVDGIGLGGTVAQVRELGATVSSRVVDVAGGGVADEVVADHGGCEPHRPAPRLAGAAADTTVRQR